MMMRVDDLGSRFGAAFEAGGLETVSCHGRRKCGVLGILGRHLANPASASLEKYPSVEPETWPN